MSFVSDASAKSSTHAASSVSPSLSSELELYKKRFRFVTLTLAGVITLGTGYGAGYWLKSNHTLSEPPSSQAVHQPSVASQSPLQQTTPKTELSENEQASSEAVTAKVSVAKVNTDAALQSPAQHYQWLSVQVGMDQLGQPIYQQQLVPVSNDGVVALNPRNQTVPTTSLSTAPAQTAPVSQPDDIASLTAQGYRVAGKPLEETKADVDLNFDGVSPELKAAFKDAVQATENNPSAEVITATNSSARVTPINALPERFKASIPPFKYLTHIYATEPSMRFIKINGRELYEGDNIGALRVVEITPEMTVFDFDGVEFSVEAMEDWPKGQG